MAKKTKKPIAPICQKCRVTARVTTGAEIYPHRPDLSHKWFWKCDSCKGYVGCHGTTMNPLGTPADAELRFARGKLHDDMLDPIWKNAIATGGYTPESDQARAKILRAARNRVYAYLAHHLGIEREQCHTGMFDIATCRLAWVILKGKSYAEIRDWYKAGSAERKAADEERKETGACGSSIAMDAGAV